MAILHPTNKSVVGRYFFLVLILAAAFSFWALDRHDVVGDEASYMVRGMRMLDFNFGIEQPTPVQWVDEMPWWMPFSFHDHPPLVFLIERFSFVAFGENLIAGRIPSVLAGLGAVILLFFIGKELYSRRVGLIGASLFAFTVGHVWVSRVALQESIGVFFMLASFYAFLMALQKRRALIFTGVLAGLTVLVKYTAVILLPIFLTILFFKRREYITSKNLLLAVSCFLFFISPIIIYNLGLYRTFGHLDFQISYVFGQTVAAWSEMPGKEEVGSFTERAKDYLPHLLDTHSPFFLFLAASGILIAMRRFRTHAVLLIFFLWLAAFMFAVGPTYRFLAMLTPWLSIFAAVFLVFFGDRFLGARQNIAASLLIAVAALEAGYAYNSVIAITPIGKTPWTYAAIRSEGNNWGYNQLENFVSQELEGKRPEPALGFHYPVIARFLDRVVLRDTNIGLEPKAWMVIYNGNMSVAVQLWTFLRRIVYQGWPTTDVETYHRILAENGPDYFKKLGIAKIYFFQNTDAVVLREVRNRPLTKDADMLEQRLLAAGVLPREIKNLRGETAFRVYEFAP